VVLGLEVNECVPPVESENLTNNSVLSRLPTLGGILKVGGTHSEREAQTYYGGLRAELQRGPGAEPLLGGGAGQGASPP